MTPPPPLGGGAAAARPLGHFVRHSSLAGHGLRKLVVLDCLHPPFSNWLILVGWLNTHNQLVLSTQVPRDFDYSESETKLNVTCPNLNRRNLSTQYLCINNASATRDNARQSEASAGTAVLLEISHQTAE